MRICALLVLLLSLQVSSARGEDSPDFDAARLQMLRVIRLETLITSDVTGIQAIDARVLAAMNKVPRHEFVAPPLAPYAYEDTPLPVDVDQNVAQPFIAALMTHFLQVKPGDIVFETETDCGYEAALLAELGAHVYSMEISGQLADAAAARLNRLGYRDVAVRTGDGYYGWAEHGPYDAILVKEAVDGPPEPLLAQLKPGGRMVAPIGPGSSEQVLTVIEKDAAGGVHRRSVLPVRFTPLQGGERI